jgi:LysR family transcriptional regulator, flagellar master operon regulator
VYSRARDSAVLQHALELLRGVVKAESDWSQRWDPVL